MSFKKSYLKKDKEELQEYLQIMRRCFEVPPKKGKGSYKRRHRNGKRKFYDE